MLVHGINQVQNDIVAYNMWPYLEGSDGRTLRQKQHIRSMTRPLAVLLQSGELTATLAASMVNKQIVDLQPAQCPPPSAQN